LLGILPNLADIVAAFRRLARRLRGMLVGLGQAAAAQLTGPRSG